jgi:cysteine synthase A
VSETRETATMLPSDPIVDFDLLAEFKTKIESRVPRLLSDRTIANATPLLDITDDLVSAAREEYGIDLGGRGARVYGKFEGKALGGSIKTRPAARIVGEAIASGALTKEKVVFEATSGNFGVSLGLLKELGLDVIVLVSRRLQDGVLKALGNSDVKTIDLDVDICPTPGLTDDSNTAVAKGVAQSVRSKLSEYGLDPARFDLVRAEAESLLARQDVIGLAKLLARAYGGFCPEQYDNELNPDAHKTITGPEIDSQLKQFGASLADFDVVCAFGTGGTSTGLSQYIWNTHRRKGVRVVYPLAGEDVAGIRVKEKASGLRFYRPHLYLGEHEADFEQASRLTDYFIRKGRSVGESSALALYATLQLVNYGAGTKFVVILADGAEKYLGKPKEALKMKAEVSLEEARSDPSAYEVVIWTHGLFTPRNEGIRLLASSLGCDPAKIKVASTRDVQSVVNGAPVPPGLQALLPKDGGNALLVCMVGSTSLMAAKSLAGKGLKAQSLKGGIVPLATKNGIAPAQVLKQGD